MKDEPITCTWAQYAEACGLSRAPGESDAAFRDRLGFSLYDWQVAYEEPTRRRVEEKQAQWDLAFVEIFRISLGTMGAEPEPEFIRWCHGIDRFRPHIEWTVGTA